ncbi:MAG: hypothetical protein IJD09_02665 [Clostridia bacterium]|nr:hypothetical protein [Clostridia bacterium]
MKVIFLDFDGVLNSRKYVDACGHFGVIIDPSRMALLKQIVDATDARIVLSTSWREHWSPVAAQCDAVGEEINRIFKEHRLEIYDKIPQMNFKREQEIKAWLEDYPTVDRFVVLDDLFLDAPFMRGHFVRTSDLRDGLDEDNVKEAIDILK